MKKAILTSLLAASALVGVVAVHAQSAKPNAAAVGPVKPRSADAPQIGNFGFDIAGMDRKIAPGDDFYDYAGGTWGKDTAIPADKSSFGAFDVLADLSRTRTHDILEAQKATGSKIGTAYAAFLDTGAIDAKGLAPIKPWMAQIAALTDKAGYPALLAKADRMGIRGPFGGGVGQDAKQPSIYALGLRQAGLGLPHREYYLDAKFALQKAAYQAHIAKMFALAGEPDADARAKALVDYETGIATVSWTRVQSRDANKTYNKMTVADLEKSAPGFAFATYFKDIGTPVDTVIVGQPTAIAGIAKAIADAPIGVLRDQLLMRSLDEYADVLPTAFDRENFAFYGTTLSGTPEQAVRWKRAVDFTSEALSDDVSKLYVAKYFPPETKAAADQLVKNIIAAMNVRIDKLTWMAPETKVKAHEKLAAFTPKIGYPSQWHDYGALTIKPGDAYGNAVRANAWQHDWNVAKLGKPLMKWEWGMTPMTVNAYANPVMVEIVFPAAILQPPFFDPKADLAVNYGGIGAVIGHEMSHHFDDQGAKFNAKGELADWWTPADVANFKVLTEKLAAQYDAYEPLPGVHVNGHLTLGENMADLAGLTVAYDAYHKALGGRTAPTIDGFTGDQRFYLGWSQVWRRNYREAELKKRLITDPHSPSPQRADIVRDMDPWYAAFSPAPSGRLVLAPDARVRVW